MRTFTCTQCDQMVFFANSRCLRCDAALGFDIADQVIRVLRDGDRRCANAGLAACNWLTDGDHPLCLSCRLTRTRPPDADAEASQAFAAAEAAKRWLVFGLLELGLPVVPRDTDPEHGLAFDLLSNRHGDVVIGHAAGVVTVAVEEADDAYRERVRAELEEPYRTMLGHLRHETGHYYWHHLVEADADRLAAFRARFGDERADYAAALQRHYDTGPPDGWQDHCVSAYATMHPWEDWAETFAQYLHIRDTLQTATAFGLQVAGQRPAHPPGAGSIQALLDAWLPLSIALNAINRSMGHDDLYPFVLAPTVIDKLGFVHEVVAGYGSPGRRARTASRVSGDSGASSSPP